MREFYAIVEGDPLDNGNGSHVVGGADHSTIADEQGRERRQAHLGHEAWCGVCKTNGPIVAGAPINQNLRGFDARLNAWEAVDGDIVNCKCSQHPRVVSVHARSVTYLDDGSVFATETSSPPASSVGYDQRFQVTNPRTGQPLRDMPYRIVTDNGEEFEGRTDAQGCTQRIASDHALSATLHVFEEETPLNPNWDREG